MSENIAGQIKSITKLGNGKHGVVVENGESRFFIMVKSGMFYDKMVEAQKKGNEVTVFAKKLVETLTNDCLGLVIDVKEENLFSEILEDIE